jgi:hypothetical protein
MVWLAVQLPRGTLNLARPHDFATAPDRVGARITWAEKLCPTVSGIAAGAWIS